MKPGIDHTSIECACTAKLRTRMWNPAGSVYISDHEPKLKSFAAKRSGLCKKGGKFKYFPNKQTIHLVPATSKDQGIFVA